MLKTECRLCGSKYLQKYLDLGEHAPSDEFRPIDDKSIQKKYPLAVQVCLTCGFSQLTYVVPPEILYKNDYPYETSSNEAGKKHYYEFAEAVVNKLKLKPNDTVIDIGSNIGVLLDGFKKQGLACLGIDPAQNIVDKAIANGVPTICDFFNSKTADKVIRTTGKVELIVGTNVFAHVDNLEDFIVGVKTLLKDDGVFIFESPSLLSLIENNGFDSVYFEHLSYLSLTPVKEFLHRFGLEIFDVEEQKVHQGSFRVFIGKSGIREVSVNVVDYLDRERNAGINKLGELLKAGEIFKDKLKKLENFLTDINLKDKTISLLSAPAKGMTLINCFKWPDLLFDIAFERSDLKIGRLCPGTNIEVMDEREMNVIQNDYLLLLAWNWKDQILKNELVKTYVTNGGKIIIPLPDIEIIDKAYYE